MLGVSEAPAQSANPSATPNSIASPVAVAGNPSTPAPGPASKGASQQEVLDAVSRIAQSAIDAANRNAVHTNEVFERSLWVIGAIGFLLTALGVTSFTSLKRQLRRTAMTKVQSAITDMRSHIEAEISEMRMVAAKGREILINTVVATRYYNLADSFAEVSADQQDYFRTAIEACQKVRAAAEALKDTQQEAWSYSFEALCRRRLNDFEGAIAAAKKSESLYERNDATLHFNLACYLCLAGHDEEAIARLRKSFLADADGTMERQAKIEQDFNRWRQDGRYSSFVGALASSAPSPESG